MDADHEHDHDRKRERMLELDLRSRDIKERNVLDAFAKVRRELFVPENLRARAYEDAPLPIDCGRSLTQPYVVARTVQALAVAPTDRVLEVGTGSGYAAAVLAHLAREVFSVERLPELAH